MVRSVVFPECILYTLETRGPQVSEDHFQMIAMIFSDIPKWLGTNLSCLVVSNWTNYQLNEVNSSKMVIFEKKVSYYGGVLNTFLISYGNNDEEFYHSSHYVDWRDQKGIFNE